MNILVSILDANELDVNHQNNPNENYFETKKSLKKGLLRFICDKDRNSFLVAKEP
jgi:hypothetical protein